jgi:FkbM family methyltransferase
MKTQIVYQSPAGEAHRVAVVVKDRHEKIQSMWLRGRFYETQRHGMLNVVYPRFRGGTFIDIGAAIGNHSLFFAQCCQADQVYAFEPVTALCEHLLQNIAVNKIGTIRVHNLALGDAPRQVGMTPSIVARPRGGMLMSKVDESGSGVRMERLDDLLRDEPIGDLRCIKIDVEGYNLPVLMGARETILAQRPAIFCECETAKQYQAVNDYLEALGYKVWTVDGKPFVMNHTATYLWEWAEEIDFHIVVTTYNRPQELRCFLTSLMADAGERTVLCRVYNDGSTLPYADRPEGTENFRIKYIDVGARHGKERYWQLINRTFDAVRATAARFYLQLPDDVEVQPGFFDHAERSYDAIADPAKIAMNLYLDHSRIGKACWTKHLPRICRFGETTVFKTGWIDMIFLAERRFFEQLDYKIQPIPLARWRRNPRLSSGVGMQISQRLRDFSIYQVRDCFLRSLPISSLMHPDRPAHEDLSTAQLDPIHCGVASIPERVQSLKGTVASILPFVDALHVYLNNYPDVPDFLNQPKIAVYRSQEFGDRGDAGKFFTVGRTQGFYLAIDDDILYPDEYVWRLVNALHEQRKRGRRVAVGLHGKIMGQEVRHFYRDHARQFHYSAALEEARGVHVLGTGTVAFHTLDLPITIADFEGPRNLADIHFSLACQKHGVGCLVLPRPKNHVKTQKMGHAGSIWGYYRQNDLIPTELYNSWPDWRIRI